MKKLSDFFFRLVRPSFWGQHYTTDYVYDELLNQILDKCEIEIVDIYTVKINGIEVWVSNFPYSYGYMYKNPDRGMPRPRTRVRLQHMVTLARFKAQLNK